MPLSVELLVAGHGSELSFQSGNNEAVTLYQFENVKSRLPCGISRYLFLYEDEAYLTEHFEAQSWIQCTKVK